MKREYYICWYRLDGKDSYLIWFSTDEDDGVFVGESNLSPSFDNTAALRNFAKSNKIKLKKEEPLLIDLDIVKNWLKGTENKVKDYNPFLNAWNLFEDISVSTNEDFHKNRNYDIYERIFWGCNIPAVTPEGESFTPNWTKKELKIIREIMNSGLKIFAEKIKPQ
jgi:hypothetical protein